MTQVTPSKTMLRNPTAEEIAALQNKNSAKIISDIPGTAGNEVANISPEITQRELKIQKFSNLGIKPQKSSFEPKPVVFKLPSGKIIVDSGEIMIRRMTTIEESVFQEAIAKNVQNGSFDIRSFLGIITRSLSTCIKSEIDILRLSLIDKIALFMFIIAISYGETHDVNLRCSNCGEITSHRINILKDIAPTYVPDNYVYPHPITLTSFDNPCILYAVFPRIENENLFFTSLANLMAQLETITYKIEGRSNEGTLIEEKDYNEILSNLNKDDKEKIKNFVSGFGQFGTSLVTVIPELCHNTQCEEYKKPQGVTVPLEELIIKVFI